MEGKLIITSSNNPKLVILPITESGTYRFDDLSVPHHINKGISFKCTPTESTRVEKRDQVRFSCDGIELVRRLEGTSQGIRAEARTQETSRGTRVRVTIMVDNFSIKIAPWRTRRSPKLGGLSPTDRGCGAVCVGFETTVLNQGLAPVTARVGNLEVPLSVIVGGGLVSDEIVLGFYLFKK